MPDATITNLKSNEPAIQNFNSSYTPNSEKTNEIMNIDEIVFEKLEEILNKLVAKHENESKALEEDKASLNKAELTNAVNPSSIDSIIDLVIQQTHISDIRRMSTDLVKNTTTSLAGTESSIIKIESLIISPNIVSVSQPIIQPVIQQQQQQHHQHHHHHHSNPTISTLLSASQMFISNENNIVNSQNASGINVDMVKIKQSKKASQGKYSVWKPKTNLVGDNGDSSNSVSNFITDKTNNLPVKVRKPHQSTLKNGEKKKEKKTIGLLNAAAANLCNQIIVNNNNSNILNLNHNNVNSTSNRKSKPPTLISSLLEQQDLLKKQQLQSKLSADSFEQIWEDHCYTPKMPWLKINAPPLTPPPLPLQPAAPVSLIPTTATTNLQAVSINQSLPLSLLDQSATTTSTNQPMFVAQTVVNEPSSIATLIQPLATANSDKTVSSILSHISPQTHQKESKISVSTHSKKSSSATSVCRELAGLLPPPVNKLESEYLLSSSTTTATDSSIPSIVQNEKRRRKELSNLTNENSNNNELNLINNNKSIKTQKKTVKSEQTKPSDLNREKTKKSSPKRSFTKRTKEEERKILESFLVNGIDQEDINFLKRTYDQLKSANVDSNNNNSDDNELATLVRKIFIF